jgi:predicted AAA+ superfamily ATPase
LILFTRFCIIKTCKSSLFLNIRSFIGGEILRVSYLNQLISWIKEDRPKPLLLWGARQVGKTHLMKTFASHYAPDSIYLNFERDKELNPLFALSLSPEDILKNLSLYLGRGPITSSTLLMFDEIQESEGALNSLKYFKESSQSYKILAAGSLLGVKLSRSGFPVGQVAFLDVYPCTFLEFLDFIGETHLAEHLRSAPTGFKLADSIHQRILTLFREYTFVGGMPEVIAEYSSAKADFLNVREIQNRILRTYQLDFAKHAPRDIVSRISEVYDKIPSHLAKENKKFMYSAISSSARARDYSTALQWLLDARILHKVRHTSNLEIPLLATADSDIFKTYFVDTGLLGAMMNVPQKLILDQQELFSGFKGALAENIAAQQLHASGFVPFYWTSAGKAEVDFVFQKDEHIIALEVKSGGSVRSKSLSELGRRFPKVTLFRASLLNERHDGAINNIPAYAVGYQKFSSKKS